VESIIVNYLELGHTYNSADSFHAMVERMMKESKYIYDFPTFVACVKRCKMHGEDPIIGEINYNDFKLWPDVRSTKKQPFSLRTISALKAIKGEMNLSYKTSHSEEVWESMQFINRNILKNGFNQPMERKSPQGIPISRQQEILKNMGNLMPQENQRWWHDVKTRNE
jgi:hypothetical protein